MPVPPNAVPRFGAPAHLVSDDFWSNLKQFLTERPVKVVERPGAPFTRNNFGGGVGENLKEFLSSRPVPKGPLNSRLAVNWGANFGGFFYRIKEFFSPSKQPPLPPGVRPVKVKEIWSKDETFGWTQVISMGLHAGVFALVILLPLIWPVPHTTEAKSNLNVTPIDISPYVTKLPAGATKAGGGGGANDHTMTPVNKGKLPKFKWTQFTPPQVKIQNLNPKLAMDPSLLGPPDLRVASPNMSTFGDPLASAYSDSLGHGNGTGIGSGTGGGLGPGEGGGTGGGIFHVGGGVSPPRQIYAPEPEFSEEARKAKYQGVCTLGLIVGTDGRPSNIRVLNSLGMGLDEKAIEAVKNWKFEPAMKDGHPVRVEIAVEVDFHLY